METTLSFGYWLRRQRKALDLTQKALADQVGCSLAAIKKIEADERRPSRQIAGRLADILGVPDSQREIFLECARGLRPVDQLALAREPGAPAAVPPQKQVTFRHNLPVQLTSFVGRERELLELKQLLTTTHLLTVTGPGGTGKTRLALQLAGEVLEEFPNGVWLVDLAPVADPTLVTQTAAARLDVRELPGRGILDALTDYVRAKTLLLILDNCEHLIDACAQLAESLLRAAPGLKILATSREALGIAGETAFRVPSLPQPDPEQLHNLDALARNDCVHLFIDRALAAYPSFRLKEKNAAAVAEICRRLDGIPLAIELASARTTVFPPEEIAARLDDRFRLLTGGSRTALERHQTLFALIEWSHQLLSEAERMLLRRLSVFAGGWSIEAVQTVCAENPGDEVLDVLTQLVNKSLVVFEEETEAARYHLPETIRQYARDKLFEAGEAEPLRERHLKYFLGFAQAAEPKLRGAEQLEWLERLETEYDNLRTALAWSLESGRSGRALELAGTLYYFWLQRGNFSEGQKWVGEALALAEREQSEQAAAGQASPTRMEMAHRARVLYAAAWFEMGALDLKGCHALVEESLRLWRELEDHWWMAVALELAGLLSSMENPGRSLGYLEEGVSLARELEDPWPLAMCLIRMGDAMKPAGNAAEARPFLEEGVVVARRIGDRGVLSEGLRELGSLYFIEDLSIAESLTQEALTAARAIGSIGVFLALMQMVVISCLQIDLAKARRYCLELWAIVQETGAPFAAVFALVAFGLAASFGERPGKGVRMIAASLAAFSQKGANLLGGAEGDPFKAVFTKALDTARAQLGPAAFETAWAEGQQMTVEQALALATGQE